MLGKGAQTLPQKDAQAFKQLAKFHDSKNYKKGLKHADKILQTHPDHPETLSLKALFELGLGQQNKALQTAKVGLMKSKMKSMFCWHTMGTIYKQKRDYLQSSKCFQNACRFQPDNIQLLRDIGAMQVQIRDYSSNLQTRLSILKLKPNMIQNWIGFILGNHLKGDYQQMFKAFKSLDTLLLSADLKPIQISHFYIYKAVACKDAEKYDIMYETLQKNKQKIKDEVLWYELCLESSLKLNKLQEAKSYLQFLINKYPQNTEYMNKYKQVYEIQTQKEVYSEIKSKYSSKIAEVLYVSILKQKDQFIKEFTSLIKPYYKKNLVSLFAQIQCIYQSSTIKRQWIQQVLEDFHQCLNTKLAYPDEEQALSPSQYLWSLYILAQHYSMKFQTLNKAYDFIVKAITHTNTVSQFYLVKAQIQYKMHNNIQSLKTINQARKTDLADRYMNNICVKYLFKCHKPNAAQQVMRLFMRDQANAYELQNHWYIIEAGKSFLKQRNLDSGLRHLNFINKQFGDMMSNEFDFHYYCIRKWTLRQYTELVAFNDNIYSDKQFMEAAYYAIQYLRQYTDYLKAEQLKKQTEEKEDQKTSKKKNKKKKNKQTQVEQLSPLQAFRKKIDYYGKQYKQTTGKNPMEEALLWSKNLSSAKFVNKNNLRQNKLCFKANSEAINVFIHFDKPLLVLKSLKKILKANYDKIQTQIISIRVLNYFERYLSRKDTNQITKQVVSEFISEHFGSKNAKTLFQQFFNSLNVKQNNYQVIKSKQCQLIIKNEESRANLISLYKRQLNQLLQRQVNTEVIPQFVFYLVHKLEYYGQFTQQQKAKLNQIYGKVTSYFRNWEQEIEKFPDSTWTMWWLSEYDIQRQELEHLEAQALQGNSKQ